MIHIAFRGQIRTPCGRLVKDHATTDVIDEATCRSCHRVDDRIQFEEHLLAEAGWKPLGEEILYCDVCRDPADLKTFREDCYLTNACRRHALRDARRFAKARP